jgi:hypothetical protein
MGLEAHGAHRPFAVRAARLDRGRLDSKPVALCNLGLQVPALQGDASNDRRQLDPVARLTVVDDFHLGPESRLGEGHRLAGRPADKRHRTHLLLPIK